MLEVRRRESGLGVTIDNNQYNGDKREKEERGEMRDERKHKKEKG